MTNSTGSDRGGARTAIRALLWLMLAGSMAGNTVVSFAGATTLVHIGFGVVSALCAAALIAQYPRGQRPANERM